MSENRPGGGESAAREGEPSRADRQPSQAVFRPRGLPLPWRLGQTVHVDFEAGAISRGRRRLPFGSIRSLELSQGVFGASDGPSWITFDATRYRDDRGAPLLDSTGVPAGRFASVLDEIQKRVVEARASGSTDRAVADNDLSSYEFRYEVKIDPGLVVLGGLGFGIFIGYEWLFGREVPLNHLAGGTGWFLAVLGAFLFAYLLWRGTASLRFDSDGVRQRRGFFHRFQSWQEISGVRFQGLELELDGRRRRIGCNISVLKGRGSPLVIRRGIRPVLTPLGTRFLRWVLSQAPERQEVPIFGSRRSRLVSRIWSSVIVGLNAVVLYFSSYTEVGEELITRGARTDASFSEPWRFFTALFLHGNAIHFAFNMLVLVSLAPWLGRVFGWFRGTLLYVASGVFGNCLAQIITDLTPALADADIHAGARSMSIGSSTAILGIIGVLLGAIYRRPYSVPLVVRARFRWAIPVVVLLTLASGLAIDRLDNAAHFGGFVAGFVLVWIIPPKKPVTSNQ